MHDLSVLQQEHDLWVERNFPAHSLEDALFGMVEEVGEMVHHYLKMKQGIRGDQEYHQREILDGMADLIIFGASVPSFLGADYGDVVSFTWNKVKHRDWVADPQAGGE